MFKALQKLIVRGSELVVDLHSIYLLFIFSTMLSHVKL